RRRHVALRELLLDLVVAQHLVDRGHVERAVVEQHAVGLYELLGDDARGALAVLVHRGVHASDRARPLEDRALVAPGHHACARVAVRPDLHLEAGGDLDTIERNLLGRGDGHLAGVAGKMWVLHPFRMVAAHLGAAFHFLRAGWLLGEGAGCDAEARESDDGQDASKKARPIECHGSPSSWHYGGRRSYTLRARPRLRAQASNAENFVTRNRKLSRSGLRPNRGQIPNCGSIGWR